MKKTKRKIAVLTGARAEYGLLKPIMKQISKCKDLQLYTLVTGCHLTKDSGYTFKEIVRDRFKINAKRTFFKRRRV